MQIGKNLRRAVATPKLSSFLISLVSRLCVTSRNCVAANGFFYYLLAVDCWRLGSMMWLPFSMRTCNDGCECTGMLSRSLMAANVLLNASVLTRVQVRPRVLPNAAHLTNFIWLEGPVNMFLWTRYVMRATWFLAECIIKNEWFLFARQCVYCVSRDKRAISSTSLLAPSHVQPENTEISRVASMRFERKEYTITILNNIFN